eukprot:3635692-Ditylum_brightwellii.AAC.1
MKKNQANVAGRSACTPKSHSLLLSQHHSDTSGIEGSEGFPYTLYVREGGKRKDAPFPAKKRCGIELRREDQVRKSHTIKAPADLKILCPSLHSNFERWIYPEGD